MPEVILAAVVSLITGFAAGAVSTIIFVNAYAKRIRARKQYLADALGIKR